MNMRRVITVAAGIVCLSGCGVRVGAPATVSSPPSSPVSGPVALHGNALGLHLDFSRAIHTPTLYCDGPMYSGPLTLSGFLGSDRAAAVVTLDSKGTARWNTPDGHRWTNVEAQAALAHGVQPYLDTPWSLHLSGPVLQGAVPHALTAWTSGGDLGADHLSGCGAGLVPVPGQTYLAEFGPELETGVRSGPLVRPILMWLSPYDAATKTVHTRFGTLTLP